MICYVVNIILFLAILYLILKIMFVKKEITKLEAILKRLPENEEDLRLLSGIRSELGRVGSGLMVYIESFQQRIDSLLNDMGFMKTVIEKMDEGVVVIDKTGKIVLINDRFYEIMAIPKGISGSKYYIDVIRELRIIELIRSVMDTKKVLREDIVLSRSSKNIYLILTGIPIISDDDLKGVAISCFETTKLVKLEEMRKDFVANVSHEIKTPVTAIKGFAETLLDGAIDNREDTIRFLNLIKNHSERLNNLVDDLLTLSSIELDEMKLEKKILDLEEVVDTVYATLGYKAQAKGLYLRKDIPSGYRINADKDRLVQILLNIVDNAIKFTESGGVTTGIEEGNILYVSDTGIGIPQNHIPRLGERFYRVDKARSREFGGTGLGLAIVKHLIKAHGWQMQIESTPKKGTRVKIIHRPEERKDPSTSQISH